jgi:hypothetical protein
VRFTLAGCWWRRPGWQCVRVAARRELDFMAAPRSGWTVTVDKSARGNCHSGPVTIALAADGSKAGQDQELLLLPRGAVGS